MRSAHRITLLLLTLLGTTLAQTAINPKPARSGEQTFGAYDTRVPSTARPLRKRVGDKSAQAPISLLSSVPTPSPANSFVVQGDRAYVCDDNEVTVLNVANPNNIQVVGTALSPRINNTGFCFAAIQNGNLTVFADQTSTTIGNNPGFAAFGLTNPNQPQPIANAPINRRFFQKPVYIGSFAFVPTAALHFNFGWERQHGDLLAVNLSNLATPTVVGALQTQVDPIYGGPNSVLGAVQADTGLIYLGGSSSTANTNNGVGRVQTIDVSNPQAMKVVAQLSVPGTIHMSAPILQGTVGVAIGNDGGWVGQPTANPKQQGKIVVAVFDVVDRRSPALITSVKTNYVVGLGGGSARIATNVFAFAGVEDLAGNPVLLVVDISNPQLPLIQAYPIGQPFSSIDVVGNTMYATLGAAGFAAYSVPGGVTQSLNCPLSVDTMVVFDRSASVSAGGFTSAKNALKSFTNALRLPTDKLGVVSFDAAAALSQQLTGDGPAARRAIDGLITSSVTASNIGAGITAAQAELTGPRRTATATPVMIVVSDGRDTGSPSAATTLAAANAAKAAGIRVIALQYGSNASTVMQSVASSPSDFYLVATP